jgi:hypothetical protein
VSQLELTLLLGQLTFMILTPSLKEALIVHLSKNDLNYLFQWQSDTQ